MKEQIVELQTIVKNLPINGCLTGSTLLGFFDDGQDVDLFTYDNKSFERVVHMMVADDKFTIMNELEDWKLQRFLTTEEKYKKERLVTIKFLYNTCVPLNIIYKPNSENIFSVISKFDLDILAVGYDIKTKQYLDISGKTDKSTASWNKWNTAYYSGNIWEVSRLLRQFIRCVKYHKRGFNTDNVSIKYREKLLGLLEEENIFNSEHFRERLEEVQTTAKLLLDILNKWLETHDLSDDESEELKIILNKF